MRFLADMGISPRSVAFLREAGYEAVHLHDLGQDRLPDPMILESVITFPLRDMRPENVNQHRPRSWLNTARNWRTEQQ